jgi:hypothetical protein
MYQWPDWGTNGCAFWSIEMPAVARFAISILVAASMMSPALAGTSPTIGNDGRQNTPLIAGQPAGVRKAQSMSDLATYGLAAGLVAVIIVAVATGQNNTVSSTTATSQ